MIFNRITQTSLDASIVYHPETGVFATLLQESNTDVLSKVC